MMKRIILFMSAIILASSLMAQTSKQVNYGSLEKKIEKSKSDLEHEKRKTKYKTWIKHGELMLEVFDAMTLSASTGMAKSEFDIIVGTPKAQSEKDVEGQTVVEYQMERTNFYFIDNLLEYWKYTNELIEEPLDIAYNSFLKSQELDEKGRADKSLTENLTKLKYNYISEGTVNYAMKNYAKSSEYFEKAVQIGEHKLVNYVDTMVVYYAGLSAQVAGNFEKAIELYKKALEYKYENDGNIYYNIFEAFTKLKRGEEGLEYLQKGFVAYPKNQNILYGMIDFYIQKDENPELVLDYINKAIETTPNEPSLHFAAGTLHDKLENFDAAEAAYKKAIEIKPDFFDALYNLGALYFNAGVKLLEEANTIPANEIEKYDEVVAKANEEFKKSIEPMEKAYKADNTNFAVIETLRNLYFRYRNQEEAFQKKYDEMNEIYQSMKE